MSIFISSAYRGLRDLTSGVVREVKKRPKTTFAAVLGLSTFGFVYQYQPSFPFRHSFPNILKGFSGNIEIDVQAILNGNKRCAEGATKEDLRCKEDPYAPATIGYESRYEDFNLPVFSSLKRAIDYGSIEVLQKAGNEGLFSKIDSLTLDLITEYTAFAGSPETLKEIIRLHPTPTSIYLPALMEHGQSHINQTLTDSGLFSTFEKEISDPTTYLRGYISYSGPLAAWNRATLLTSLVPKKPDYVDRFLDRCASLETSITTQLYRADALALLKASIQHGQITLTEKIASTFKDLSAAELFELTKSLEEKDLTTNRELSYLKLKETAAFNQLSLLDIAKLPITAWRSSQIGDALRTRYSELMEEQKPSLYKADFEELLSHLGEEHTLTIITQPEEDPPSYFFSN